MYEIFTKNVGKVTRQPKHKGELTKMTILAFPLSQYLLYVYTKPYCGSSLGRAKKIHKTKALISYRSSGQFTVLKKAFRTSLFSPIS